MKPNQLFNSLYIFRVVVFTVYSHLFTKKIILFW